MEESRVIYDITRANHPTVSKEPVGMRLVKGDRRKSAWRYRDVSLVPETIGEMVSSDMLLRERFGSRKYILSPTLRALQTIDENRKRIGSYIPKPPPEATMPSSDHGQVPRLFDRQV